MPVSIEPTGWSQFRFGEDIFEGAKVLQPREYSYVPMQPTWLNDHWIGQQLLAYPAFRLGWPSLGLGVAANAFVILALVFAPAVARGTCIVLSIAVAALVFVLIGRTELTAVSAVLPSFLPFMLAASCFAACRARQLPGWCLFFLPLIFACWINTDESAVFGLILLAVACADCWLPERGKQPAAGTAQPAATTGSEEPADGAAGTAQPAASAAAENPAHGAAGTARVARAPSNLALFATVALILSALACCCTPYGPNLLVAGWHDIVSPPPLPEWHALHAASNLGMAYLALAALAAWCAGIRLPAFFLFLSPYYALRFLPYATLGLALAVMRNGHPNVPLLKRLTRLQLSAKTQTAAAVLSVALLVFAGLRASQMNPADSTANLPNGALDYMREHHMSGNMAIGAISNWGDYCLYKWPFAHPSIDSRWNHAYAPAALDEYLSFRWGLFPWDAAITREPTNMVLASKETAIFNLMKLTPGWKLVFEDNISGLFVKSK